MRLPYDRGGLRWYLMALGLLAGQATPSWIALGVPFLLAGIALHLWAKGCLHQNREVTTAGPYRFVRHPFYLGNAFLDIGIVLMSGWWLLQVAFPFWWLAVYIPTMRREEAAMTDLFGDAYRAYAARVGLLIPLGRPLPRQTTGFSWRNPNILGTEVPRVLKFLSYPLMFVISHSLSSRGAAYLTAPTTADALTAVTCLALYAAALGLRRHFRDRRPLLPAWVRVDRIRFALLLGVVGIGVCVTAFEVENEWVIWPPGLLLLGLSAVLRLASQREPAAAEALLAVGNALLFELVWLAVLIVPLYLAIVLDRRLSDTLRESATGGRRLRARLLTMAGHAVVIVGGVALAIAKESYL